MAIPSTESQTVLLSHRYLAIEKGDNMVRLTFNLRGFIKNEHGY